MQAQDVRVKRLRRLIVHLARTVRDPIRQHDTLVQEACADIALGLFRLLQEKALTSQRAERTRSTPVISTERRAWKSRA